MDNEQLLKSIGLTEGEAKVYAALLKLGTTKKGPLAREAAVSSSKVYEILDRLARKGLAGHIVIGNVRHFRAMSPNHLLGYLAEEEQAIKKKRELVEQMIPLLSAKKQRTEATLYEGMRAIRNFYRNMLDDLTPGETYHVLGAGYGSDALGTRAFFQNYHTQRAKREIKVKMLANHDTEGNLVPATKHLAEIRFLPQYFAANMIVVFYRDKSFIFFLTETPTAFLMESEEAAKSFKAYFDTLWKIAAPSGEKTSAHR